ncbi:MAG: hypothetical protein A3D93_02665 [Acidobacteria bacterium RIFCSPHIGHO2_12_FULL_67_30]|nr:MAG: hypothetical protein A3B65_04475 [Acidobacteria bacterium RIFCSPHIGHO2_02_FULL_67_57]OFV86380.1 MAG: hypothetical protein A2620_07365 [Acidobacteria bacterium RIFCSPHIGHO2_01_FULL_67_28]OFV86791.1 MAG: hypothetical protein A3D93_02665 [Acidobacteria bacterium RIFCSPHIGHO2_12_FULL_67_30]
MTTPLPVATDFVGLERYAYRLFAQAGDEGQARQPARLRGAALDPERLDTFVRASAVPLAYRLWLAHLLWLEEVLHTLECRSADVTGVELAGLQALGRARARFLSTRQ